MGSYWNFFFVRREIIGLYEIDLSQFFIISKRSVKYLRSFPIKQRKFFRGFLRPKNDLEIIF